MGNIGEVVREIEFEPFPEEAPAEPHVPAEPEPAVAEPVPAEPVPA